MTRFGLAAAGLALSLLLAGAQNPARAARFEFAAIGDMPYGAEAVAEMALLIEEMNRDEGLSFVVHVGDLKSGATPCEDAILDGRRQLFDASAHPFVYLPGDNEWVECHLTIAGGYDPIERLQRLRQVFWSDGFSLGRSRMALVRQSEATAIPAFAPYAENVRWIVGGVVFVTLNMPGDNNGLGQSFDGDSGRAGEPVQALDDEFPTRNAANLAWLEAAFDLAEAIEAAAVVVFIQANPLRYLLPTPGQVPSARNLDAFPLVVPLQASSDGYTDFLKAFRARAGSFGRPVLLVHGDTHTHRVDKPFAGELGRLFAGAAADGGFGDGLDAIDNVTRLEVYGETPIRWTRVIVDTDRPAVFAFQDGGPRLGSAVSPCQRLAGAAADELAARRDACFLWLVAHRGVTPALCQQIADAGLRQTCLEAAPALP